MDHAWRSVIGLPGAVSKRSWPSSKSNNSRVPRFGQIDDVRPQWIRQDFDRWKGEPFLHDERFAHRPNRHRGLVIVYTGHGKGKTTAALGLAMRAIGQGFRVAIIQFIKGAMRYGELKTAELLPNLEWIRTGIGFTWTKTPAEHRATLARGWAIAREKILSGAYDLVILDEINNALAITSFPIDDVLPLAEVLQTLKERPAHVHVVLTGRDAQPRLIELADLVTRMELVKHPYQEGQHALPGIEF